MPRTGGVFGGAKPVLEIKPHSPFVVFYGEPSASQDTELTGKLVLTNPEPMSVRSIKITLTGRRKVSWSTTGTITPQPVLSKTVFLRHDLSIFSTDGSRNKSHKINAGVHEWDFKFPMSSAMDESFEGISTNWIIYDLSATVDRGYLSKQLTASRHIRVIRTLSRDLEDTVPMEQINEDIWASKLAYKITVPQKNYIVGSSITADFVLIPLRKGVEISTIKMELIESRVLYQQMDGRRISHSHDSVICQAEGHMPDDAARHVRDDAEERIPLMDESYHFKMSLELPKSLKKCRQDIDTEHIKFSHKLRIYVNLHNPEGHTSQLLVKNFVHLFLSPHLPPGEDQSVRIDDSIMNAVAMRDEAHQNAPPTYGLHHLDELYNDIDPSGYMTPGARGSLGNSGANSPYYGHSRSGSAENLASLGGVANQNAGGPSSAALQSRLQNLTRGEDRIPRVIPTRAYSSGGTPRAPPNRAEEPPRQLPTEYDMQALARIPSYNTAVRTPVRTPTYEDLPTYEIATSRPASPSRTPRSGHSTPSPARSLNTVTEETERNTRINSRRASPRPSPRPSPRNSNEGR
ncbi:hypothetical protein K469DRAFT_709530 [Zopfia rhizophila CBS 207.26]|uniref:Arrestin C-terminal-like domain-containing protein n=1 Tax=Zopfia rhizophila CBS 207.26 TaxID=1314779 RepID=A0A6A6ETG7_9PEZI|nr:hypothetical protein K469DRAFT_709530 [Zopfia rhizophila CBS 207.26]